MSLSVLPGQPNNTQQSVCQANWQSHTILAYCSGNNVIITTSNQYFQTIYLNEDCHCCDINEINGFIAIGVGTRVLVYKPMLSTFPKTSSPKWIFCCSIEEENVGLINALKWSSIQTDSELIVGSKFLCLWKIRDKFGDYIPILLWKKIQPCPVFKVDITQDSQLICSMGKYDKTVKVWKRITVGTDISLFEVSILNHGNNAFITSFRWKRLADWDNNEIYSYVLYTLSSDQALHIWTVYAVGGKKIIEMWGEIQLEPHHRFACILDKCLLVPAFPKNNADYLFTSDKNGTLNVYELCHLSYNPPKLLKVRKMQSKTIKSDCFSKNPKFLYFPEIKLLDDNKDQISFVVHDVNGTIRHSIIDPKNLLTACESDNSVRAELKNKFTGHFKSIQKLIRSSDGESVLSLSRYSFDNCLWVPKLDGKLTTLRKFKVFKTVSPIHDAVVLEKGRLVVLLLQTGYLQIWRSEYDDTKVPYLKDSFKIDRDANIEDLVLLINVPTKTHSHFKHFISLIYRDGTCITFKVENDTFSMINTDSLDLDDFCEISSIDPVSYHYDGDRPIISLVTRAGIIKCFKGIFENENKTLKWHLDSIVHTGKRNISKIKGSSIDKICCIDETQYEVTIWDLKRGVLEYQEIFEEKVLDIDWTSIDGTMSIFSLGFSTHTLTYTQLRYDYTHDLPSYCPIRKTDIAKLTSHSIGDSLWLHDGIFMIAAGNQILLKNKCLDVEHDFMARRVIGSREIKFSDIFHLSIVLNGPLPVYHPQFLVQAIYMGKIKLTKEILLKLFAEIRKFELHGEGLNGLESSMHLDFHKFITKSDVEYCFDDEHSEPFDKYSAVTYDSLREKLTKVALPDLTRHQQVTLLTITETLQQIERLGSSLDYYGINFILGLNLYHSHKKSQTSVTMRDVSWALHSSQKDILFSEVDDERMTWAGAKTLKLAYWARQDDLLKKMEQIAKIEFSECKTRDPNVCSIFYLSLKKKQVLQGLWRISAGHPEQSKMLNFLKNDFSEERWRTAAMKNAFVLLSKHRFVLAACFFLLADSLKDCVNVLIRKVEDVDLAIAVCRAYEGDNGSVLYDILKTQILPKAMLKNDRWTISFVYYKMMRKNLAIRSLIQNSIELESTSKDRQKDIVNDSFMVDDPALLCMYQALRSKNLKYFEGALEISEDLEYMTLRKVADVYRRLGCDYLGLSVLRNWNFMDRQKITKERGGNNTELQTKVSPSSSSIYRPSIFDKFDQPPRNVKIQRSILDDFYENGINQTPRSENVGNSKPRNILSDFLSPSDLTSEHTEINEALPQNKVQETSTKKIKNLLDDFMVLNTEPTQAPVKNLLDEFSGEKMTPSPKPQSSVYKKPRNLLDDFM